MLHIQLKIKAQEEEQEKLIALLNEYCSVGFEQHDDILVAYFNKDDYPSSSVIKIVDGYDYTVSEVEERNWNEEWERNFEPVVVDNFCAIRAHFHQPFTETQHEIIITPKMSFGTGHHPTTHLMVQAMRDIEFTDKSVFDFGTGTGILAILASMLGAKEVTAIDVDDWSVTNAGENFERNATSGISLQQSTEIPSKTFDIILANINRNVILQYLSGLKLALNPGGTILFSGLMVQDEEVIIAAASERQLYLEQRLERKGWIALRFNKVL